MFTASLFHQVLPSFAWTEPFRLDRFSRDPFCNLHMWKHHFRTRVVIRRQTCPRRLAADLSRITVMRNSLIRQNPSVYDGKKDRKEFRCRRKTCALDANDACRCGFAGPERVTSTASAPVFGSPCRTRWMTETQPIMSGVAMETQMDTCFLNPDSGKS
ncbi:hypothetical protein ROHU_023139 [Labeo rohita]|uniref:Uncharacterized protein n=1 Tax=Labeo rohita TaxID=84645 RepID=A0A498MTJ2_LABRO|nr:hypothetical protein ROHU_023139 [Labeo rohita]